MAEIIRQFTATVPASTTKASPYTLDMTLLQLVVVSVDLEVPPGPEGLMGFYLALGGTQTIPEDVGEWIIWDDTRAAWPLENQTTAGTWQLVGYNDDAVNAHNVVVRFHCNVENPPSSSPPTLTIVQSATDQYLVTL